MPGLKIPATGYPVKNRGIILKYLKGRLSIRKCRIFDKLSAASGQLSARAWINRRGRGGRRELKKYGGEGYRGGRRERGALRPYLRGPRIEIWASEGENPILCTCRRPGQPKKHLFQGYFLWGFLWAGFSG